MTATTTVYMARELDDTVTGRTLDIGYREDVIASVRPNYLGTGQQVVEVAYTNGERRSFDPNTLVRVY